MTALLTIAIGVTIWVLYRWEAQDRPADPRPIPRPAPAPVPVDDPTEDDDEDDDDEEMKPVDVVDLEPDPLDEPTPYDSKRCWGCAKRCTYRGFRTPGGSTADAIHQEAERCYRAEHGCASDLDAVDGADVGHYSQAADEIGFNPISVAQGVRRAKLAAWFERCETCLSDLRARRDNPPVPTVEPAATVAADECPF